MKKIGIIGLGDMGIGLSRNILKAGFELNGFDLRSERRDLLKDLGGTPCGSISEVCQNSDVVMVMVMNGTQVQSVVLDSGGLMEAMPTGSYIIVSSTIKPSEIRVLVEPLKKKGIHLIDSPVSGGKSGAEKGTLTMMAATSEENLNAQRDLLQAVGKDIYHVGTEAGQGQTVKGALQALIGSSFTAIFE